MEEALHSNSVLVLNRGWQAINITTPAHAFCQMMSETARGLDIMGNEELVPVKWEKWMNLEIRAHDSWVGTARGKIRVPTVIVLASFSKVPKRQPKFSAKAIRDRDNNRCQYTGRVLKPGEGNIDHVVPRSKGGETSWTNCVWAAKSVNSHKADRTPREANLKLLRTPRRPSEIPVTYALRNSCGIKDWTLFLPEYASGEFAIA